MTRKDLPPVSSPNFLEKLREAVSVYLGHRGDDLDRGLTVRDLEDAGAAGKVINAAASSAASSAVAGISLLTVNNINAVYEPELTAPPIPSGFSATAAISNITVSCDNQTYIAGHGHYRSVLYGATWVSGALPTFGTAVVLTEFAGSSFSYPTNPATTWHLWLKWMSRDGVLSHNPAGGTNGVVVTTGDDVSLLLTALTGEIRYTELHAALGTRVDMVDGGNASVINLGGQYTVKLDAGNKVSGYGLANTATNSGTASSFAVRADRFYVAPPAVGGGTATDIIPFIVQAASTTINGKAVPVGVYMDTAFLRDGTITTAKIGELQVDTANLAAAAITTAKINDAAITTAKIDLAQITTALVNDAAITTAKINDSAITTAKIDDAAITTAKINNASITTAKIANAQITSAHLATAAIDTAAIGTAVVTTLKIGANNVSIGVGTHVGSYWMYGTYYGTGASPASPGGILMAGSEDIALLNIDTEGYPIYGSLTCGRLAIFEAAVGGIPAGATSFAHLEVWITGVYANPSQVGGSISGYLQPQFGNSYVWPFPDIIYGGNDSKAMSFVVPNPGLGVKTLAVKLLLHGDGSATQKTIIANKVSLFAIGLKR